MSEHEIPAAPEAPEQPKAKARAKAVKPVEDFKFYRTPREVEQSFSIPCASGKSWLPYGFDTERRLMFRVAADEAERFERHLFFRQGRLEAFDYEPND